MARARGVHERRYRRERLGGRRLGRDKSNPSRDLEELCELARGTAFEGTEARGPPRSGRSDDDGVRVVLFTLDQAKGIQSRLR